MIESPSRYGGIAAVLVFGIGLLAVGKTSAGVAVLVLGVVVMAVALAPNAAGKALFAGIGAIVLSGLLGYHAISNEVSGTATYYRSFGRGSRAEQMTQEASPEKFREATNFLWAGSIRCVMGGVIAFRFAKKLDDCADDFEDEHVTETHTPWGTSARISGRVAELWGTQCREASWSACAADPLSDPVNWPGLHRPFMLK